MKKPLISDVTIALKQSAITKEKKKRSKANLDTIELWEKEIRSLERSSDYLNFTAVFRFTRYNNSSVQTSF